MVKQKRAAKLVAKSKAADLSAETGIVVNSPDLTKWIPVRCKLPESDTTVLVYMPKSDEQVWQGYFDMLGEVWRSISGEPLEGRNTVTHWQERPDPPKQ